MSKTDLSGVWGFKGTSQLAKLTELQGYREKSTHKKKLETADPPLYRAVGAICFIRISSNASQGWKYTPMSTTYSKETFQLVRAAENVPVKVQSILAKLGR